MASGNMESDTKGAEAVDYTPSVSQGTATTKWQDALAELKYMLFTKDGLIGDYVRYCSHTH